MDQFNFSLELSNQNIFLHHYIHEIGGYRYNWHKEIELMLILSGKIEVCVEGDVYHLEEGDIILINSNFGHASLKKEQDSLAMVLHIDPVYFSNFYKNHTTLRFHCNSANSIQSKSAFDSLRKLLAQLMMALMGNKTEDTIAAQGYIALLAYNLVSHFPPEHVEQSQLIKDKSQQKLVRDILIYIEKNYNKKITLQDIARIVKYNTSYISCFFKNNIGVNFYEYLTRVRLQHAVSELLTTEKAIMTIALDNGFSDVKAFNASFRKNFNKSPHEYRCQNDQRAMLLSSLIRQFVSIDNPIALERLKIYSSLPDKGEQYSEPIPKNENKIEDTDNLVEIGEFKLVCSKEKEDMELIRKLLDNNFQLKLQVISNHKK